jgi:two-component system sensor histidine kinase YesM
VENALYHGIKNKREGGVITIKGYKSEDDRIVFKINDNGAGMTEERYKEVQAELQDDSKEMVIKDRGFGLSNVHKRIKLYYGDQYGLSISTENKIGTEVLVVIPIRGELGV